jgi:hypothetical protein
MIRLMRWEVLTLATSIMVAWPAPVHPQAVCSAPHSSPVLAGGGSIETLAPRSGWLQASVYGQRSSEFFGTGGDRQPFLAGGRVRTRSLYVTAALGLFRGIDVWAQLPVHNVSYVDDGGSRERSGFGDPRLALRVGPELVGLGGVPLAIRAGVKLPGSQFPVDAAIIPLSEGQTDWELSVETGRAFTGLPLYLLAWAGYRWRGLNETADRKPGDEWFGHLAAGGPVGAFRWELAAEYLRGHPPRHLGFEVPASRRRLMQLQPTVARRVGPGDLEFTSQVPLVGRNLPSGPGFSLGYRIAWGGGS